MHPEVRVPFREIKLSPTKSFNGRVEANEPERVYDCSGPGATPPSAATSSTACRRCGGSGFWPGAMSKKSGRPTIHSPGPQRCRRSQSTSRGRTVAGEAGQGRHPIALRAPGHHHPRDGVHCHPREPGAESNQAITQHGKSRQHVTWRRIFRRRHPRLHYSRSSSAPKWPGAARSSRPTSTTRRASR